MGGVVGDVRGVVGGVVEGVGGVGGVLGGLAGVGCAGGGDGSGGWVGGGCTMFTRAMRLCGFPSVSFFNYPGVFMSNRH